MDEQFSEDRNAIIRDIDNKKKENEFETTNMKLEQQTRMDQQFYDEKNDIETVKNELIEKKINDFEDENMKTEKKKINSENEQYSTQNLMMQQKNYLKKSKWKRRTRI